MQPTFKRRVNKKEKNIPKIALNLQPNSKLNRQRKNLGLSRLDNFRYSISAFDTQWTLMSTPAFSAVIPLTVIATGAADDQRGTDPTPLISKSSIKLLLFQEVDLRTIYRVMGVTMLPRIVTTGATIIPLTFFPNAPNINNNFYTQPFLLERNQPYPFKVWLDTTFTVDTNKGCQSTLLIKNYKIPESKTEYATSDATGATATGHQFILILCDASVDVYHTYDYSMNRIFFADK